LYVKLIEMMEIVDMKRLRLPRTRGKIGPQQYSPQPILDLLIALRHVTDVTVGEALRFHLSTRHVYEPECLRLRLRRNTHPVDN